MATSKGVKDHLQGFESVGAGVLEFRQLVNDQSVKAQGLEPPDVYMHLSLTCGRTLDLGDLEQPIKALWVDHVNVSISLQSFILVWAMEHLNTQAVEVGPLLNLLRPDVITHTEWGDQEHFVDQLLLLEEFDDSQCDGCFTQPRIQE